MKKIVLSLVLVATVATATIAQVTFAPEAGLNMSNLVIKSAGSTWNTSMRGGLKIGGVADIGLTNNLSLQPGLFFLKNRCMVKVPDYIGGGYIDQGYSMNTLEVPVNLQYKFGHVGGNRFFIGAGPYLAYNMSGKVISNGVTRGMNIGSDMSTAQGPGDDIKPIDVGMGLNAGYQFSSGFFVRAQYQMGISNLDPMSNVGNSIRSSGMGISAGYYFGGKKSRSGHHDVKK